MLPTLQVIPIPGSSSTTRTVENIKAAGVTITQQEKDEIDEILSKVCAFLDVFAEMSLYVAGRLVRRRCLFPEIGTRIKVTVCYGVLDELIKKRRASCKVLVT